MKKSIEEIKKLQEEISALRQENIQLKVCMILPIRVCCYFVSKRLSGEAEQLSKDPISLIPKLIPATSKCLFYSQAKGGGNEIEPLVIKLHDLASSC